MKIIQSNRQEYSIRDYHSNIQIFIIRKDQPSDMVSIECTGDYPVMLSGRKYKNGPELANAITKHNIVKLVKRFV